MMFKSLVLAAGLLGASMAQASNRCTINGRLTYKVYNQVRSQVQIAKTQFTEEIVQVLIDGLERKGYVVVSGRAAVTASVLLHQSAVETNKVAISLKSNIDGSSISQGSAGHTVQKKLAGGGNCYLTGAGLRGILEFGMSPVECTPEIHYNSYTPVSFEDGINDTLSRLPDCR